MSHLSRHAWINPNITGAGMTIRTGQGVITLRRVDPHGVEIVFGGVAYGVTSPHLALIGRYFLAAAILQGQDINADWDGPQHSQDEGFVPPL